MYRIVDDPMPPIPEEWSPLLKDFLHQCFQREPADRPSADVLCEHEWLKEFSEIHKILRPKDSIPFLRRVSTDLQKVDAVRFVGVVDRDRERERERGREMGRADSRDSRADSERAAPRSEGGESPSPSPFSAGLPGSPPRKRLSNGPATPRSTAESELPGAREHNFIDTSFSKREFLFSTASSCAPLLLNLSSRVEFVVLTSMVFSRQRFSAESVCRLSRRTR